CHGVVSGYACGGPGEPCGNPPRPYFRQNNDAIRAQIAKIVYLSLTTSACGGKAPAQGTPTPTPAATATPPPACGLFWRYVSSPNPGSYNIFYAVAAVATNDVWAVDFTFNGSLAQTLIEHWNGSSWSVVSSPNVGSLYNFLQSIAVVAANDVWAV